MTHRIRSLLVSLPVLAALAGCGGGDDPGASPGADDPLARDTTGTAGASLQVTGLTGPEAVRYDPEQDVFFVANFGADADDPRDANGFISRVDPEGAVRDLRFMVGTPEQPLHMPRGMIIRGDSLWVADVDGIHAFDRRSGSHLRFVDFREHEPGFLNDLAIDPSGTVYVTDSGRGRVYRVAGERAEVAVADLPATPNGITWDPERESFLLAPWEGDAVLRAWDPATGETSEVASLPGGRIDGVEVVDGRVVLASQADSTLYVLESSTAQPLVRVPGLPADIGIDTQRGRVAVPYIALDRVDLFPLR